SPARRSRDAGAGPRHSARGAAASPAHPAARAASYRRRSLDNLAAAPSRGPRRSHRRTPMRRFAALALVASLALVVLPALPAHAESHNEMAPSLYKRLG